MVCSISVPFLDMSSDPAHYPVNQTTAPVNKVNKPKQVEKLESCNKD